MIKCLANLPVNLIRRLARTVVASTNMFSELYDVGFEMSDYKRQEQPVACWCEYKGKFKNELYRWGKCWKTSVQYCVYWKYIEPVLKLVARKVPETSLMLTPQHTFLSDTSYIRCCSLYINISFSLNMVYTLLALVEKLKNFLPLFQLFSAWLHQHVTKWTTET